MFSMVAPNSTASAPLGLGAFDSLRAEDEPWLADYGFQKPPEFDLMAGTRSIIVYAQPGGGKTALRLALARQASFHPRRMIVEWKPEPVEADQASLVNEQIDAILAQCARQILIYLAREQDQFLSASKWVQALLPWFIQQYLGADPAEPAIGQLVAAEDLDEAFVEQVITKPVQNLVKSTTTRDQVIAQLAQAMSSLKFEAIWVMMDGLEDWSESDPEALAERLMQLLSSLTYFSIPKFAFKLMLPAALEDRLSAATAITRQRVGVHRMEWTQERLKSLVTQRLRLATGQSNLKLADIYAEKNLVVWLTGCGGLSPRGWLEYLRPIIAEYLEIIAGGSARPLNKDEWSDARKRTSLRFELDVATGKARVGLRDISTLSKEDLALLRYLYEHQDQVCSKRDLYYKAYLPMSLGIDKPSTEVGNELPFDYEGLIDTALYRLRQDIEPEPSKPIFIVTERNKGIVLKLQAFR